MSKENNNDEPDIEELKKIIPSMNLNVPKTQENQDVSCIVSDDMLLGLYGEILTNLRDDRLEIDQLLSNFVDMVINEGDSTTSSKEAVVNLVKIKNDTADKMTKVADLMTRIKLRERDTFPKYLAAHQNNTINIGDSNNKRALIEALNKAKKEKNE